MVLREKRRDGFEALLHQTCRGSTRWPWLRCAAGSTVVMTPRRSGIWQHDRPPIRFRPVFSLVCQFVSPPPYPMYPDIDPKHTFQQKKFCPWPALAAVCHLPSVWFGSHVVPRLAPGPKISKELLKVPLLLASAGSSTSDP